MINKFPKIKKLGDARRKQQQEIADRYAREPKQATIALNKKLNRETGRGYKFYTVWQTENPSTVPMGASGTLSMLKAKYSSVTFYKRVNVGRMKFDPSMDTLPVLTRNDL